MKIASIILKIVAILGAAFCVYAWLDTRGKISTSENHMKDVKGADIVAKASNVPGILKNLAAEKNKTASLQKMVGEKEGDINKLNSELESERSKNVRANSEISKKNSELRVVRSELETQKGIVAEKDTLIETLKKEIVASKQLVTDNKETDALKEKVAALESQLATSQKELEEANKKAKILEMSEVVEVIETNADGKKVKRTIVKTPYVPTGDIATVISVDQQNKIVALNKGKSANVKKDQKILLKREGKPVAEILITEVFEDHSVAMMNRDVAIPETVEVNDLLEMASPVVAAPVVPAEKPAENAEEAKEESESADA